MQISNQLVNTAFSRSSTTRTRVFLFPFFSLCFAVVRAFFIYIVNFLIAFFFLFLHRSFLSFFKHTKDYRKYNSQIVMFISVLYFIVNIDYSSNILCKYCNKVPHLNKKERQKKQLHINYLFYDQCIICKCKNITTSFFNPVISFSLSVGPVQVICAGALAVLMGSH